MSVYEKMTALADAIRHSTGLTEKLSIDGMTAAVQGMESHVPAVADGSVTTLAAADLAGVTSLRNYAFYGCSDLSSVALPDTLTSIGTYAFNNCSALSDIVLPSGLTSIGARAFQNCKALEAVVIPEGVTSLPAFCFSGSGLRTLILVGDTVKEAQTANIFSSTPLNTEELPIYIATVNGDAEELVAAYAAAENWGDYFIFAPVSEYEGEW